jgi:hypothetical protein
MNLSEQLAAAYNRFSNAVVSVVNDPADEPSEPLADEPLADEPVELDDDLDVPSFLR